jgi:succinate dehydrogenase/fumarate reductase flavoprotein subunit
MEDALVKCDVLVVGGGLGGCLAAIKASEYNVKVILVEKANAKRSGSAGTGNDHFWCYISEIHSKAGLTIEDVVKDMSFKGPYGKLTEGFIDQELCESIVRETYDRVLDLEMFGVKFRFKKIYSWNYFVEPGEYEEAKFRIVPAFQSVPDVLNYEGRDIKRKLTKEAKKRSVNIMNRVMVTSLLTHEGSVVGATGVNTRTGQFIVFEAKAIVLHTGGCNRLYPTRTGYLFNRQDCPNLTGDGEVMALKAGAELFVTPARKRGHGAFQYLKNFARASGAATSCYPAGRYINSEGEVVVEHPASREPLRVRREKVEADIREGRLPFYLDLTQATEEQIKYVEWSYGNEGLCWAFLEIMRDMGLDFRKDIFELDLEKPGTTSGGGVGIFIETNCATSVKGLFAGGDIVQPIGAETTGPQAVVLGWRAGDRAAEYALKAPEPVVDERQIRDERRRVLAPLKVEDGVAWQELNVALNSLMTDYMGYVGGLSLGLNDARSKHGLESLLNRLRELRSQPLSAKDPHEVMRCLEVLNLIDVGELLVKAALDPRIYEKGKWFMAELAVKEMKFFQRPIVYKYPIE